MSLSGYRGTNVHPHQEFTTHQISQGICIVGHHQLVHSNPTVGYRFICWVGVNRMCIFISVIHTLKIHIFIVETPIIRPAKAEDIPRLIEIIQTTIESYDYIFELEFELPDFLDFDTYYQPGHAELYVIETEAGIIGCGALKLDKPIPYLSRIYVTETERGKGWGKRIVQFLMQRNQELGNTALELWSDTKFRTAHAMYEKLGFVFSGRVRPLWDINYCFEYHYSKE